MAHAHQSRSMQSLPSQIISAAVVLMTMAIAPRAQAQSTEDRFHDLFVTAGYATAFGAALGAAALSFTKQPENHLKYVAVGASLGFIGGSAMGSYIIFSPVFVGLPHAGDTRISLESIQDHKIVLRPIFSKEWALSGVETGMTLARF